MANETLVQVVPKFRVLLAMVLEDGLFLREENTEGVDRHRKRKRCRSDCRQLHDEFERYRAKGG